MYLHPFSIGALTLAHNIVFGPMAGVSDLPFRLLCHEQGSALGVTELISAKAITYRNRNTKAMLGTHPDEGPVAIQLFGHEPEVFAEAVRMMQEMEMPDAGAALRDTGREPEVPGDGGILRDAGSRRGVRYDILDINMGCPVPKVVSNGEGSALMKRPRLIEAIVRACAEAEKDAAGRASVEAESASAAAGPCGTASPGAEHRKTPAGTPVDMEACGPRPVTVKLRSGFDRAHVNAVECALAAEAGGASAVAVHARTRDMMYGGRADWKVIRAVKDALRIPVIGNGDVTDAQSAKAMFEETGCDGVMVARAAQGNPWIFGEITGYLETGVPVRRPDAGEIHAMVRRHFDLLLRCKGEYTAVREMRRHIGWYTAGIPGASRMRDEVNRTETATGLLALCGRFFGG